MLPCNAQKSTRVKKMGYFDRRKVTGEVTRNWRFRKHKNVVIWNPKSFNCVYIWNMLNISIALHFNCTAVSNQIWNVTLLFDLVGDLLVFGQLAPNQCPFNYIAVTRPNTVALILGPDHKQFTHMFKPKQPHRIVYILLPKHTQLFDVMHYDEIAL